MSKMSKSIGVKADKESTAGFVFQGGKGPNASTKVDHQRSTGRGNKGPDMDINSAALLKAAGTTLMSGASAYRGKGGK